MGKVAYRLKSPSTAQIHHTFHASQLQLFRGVLPTHPHIPSWLPGRDAEVVVKAVVILDRKMVKRGNKAAVLFLIQWEGQTPKDASWQDADHML